MPEFIYILGMDGKPQMPTTRRRHVHRADSSFPERGSAVISSHRDQKQGDHKAHRQTPGMQKDLQKWGAESKTAASQKIRHYAESRDAHAEASQI